MYLPSAADAPWTWAGIPSGPKSQDELIPALQASIIQGDNDHYAQKYLASVVKGDVHTYFADVQTDVVLSVVDQVMKNDDRVMESLRKYRLIDRD